MSVLVDSDVLVDCLRGTPEAGHWLAGVRNAELSVPGIVAMELLAGCRNRQEQGRVLVLIERFPVVWPTPDEGAAALDLYVRYGLAHGIGVLDCLVAAIALSRQTSLLTFNRRHFGAVDGLVIQAPYQRS